LLRPRNQRVAILEDRGGHAEVLHRAAARPAVGIRLERPRARSLAHTTCRFVALQVQHIAREQREEQITGIEPDVAEHALRRQWTDSFELFEHEGQKTLGDSQNSEFRILNS
jgi:hypothetical protein